MNRYKYEAGNVDFFQGLGKVGNYKEKEINTNEKSKI